MSEQSTALLNTFRVHYHRLVARVEATIQNGDDSTVVARIGDEADELLRAITEQIQTNISLLQSDIQAQYRDVIDHSHHGHPIVMQQAHTGGPGRPSYIIDPDFLAWAYSLRSTSSISRFLGQTYDSLILEQGSQCFMACYVHLEVFERFRIRRRTYSVPGPNSLWHHDGQHRLIRWGIVIHGFIDGYSRLIVGLRAHNNNRGQTVLDLFLEAAQDYGVPERIRGDHGIENILIAAWMEAHCTSRRSPYIWGRSVHNVRIERLWVDVTAQVGSHWHEAFIQLELHHGLDINNPQHLWLLQTLFLPVVNEQLSFFSEGWNQHRIQIRDGPNRSPADMFAFDMLTNGVRRSQLPFPEISEAEMTDEELEEYGVDWEGLDEDRLLLSLRQATPIDEAPTSWIGRIGPPDNLNQVHVEQPPAPSNQLLVTSLNNYISQCIIADESIPVSQLWELALGEARRLFGSDLF
ncbi:hypothetical protein EST38_g8582 [Candolleomyces aberdarensis]|uniref:Integrase catalytic domain-containing protein n=1 Tax=Candolleomyces aberdarensis TaxID=2316362 RepID=A0A4Q2DF12_9AGAR|nr:hypothetical protein EST38_g8582 [Candolleomyces aberdarensis]